MTEEMLRNLEQGVAEELKIQQKLDYVVERIVDTVLAQARSSRVSELMAAAPETAVVEVSLE